MFATLDQATSTLRTIVSRLDVSGLDGDAAVRLVDAFAEVERLASAGRILAAKRVEETKAWYGSSYPSAAHWMAARAGTSVSAAVSVLKTARELDALPATKAALTAGDLSIEQAAEVTAAASVNPAFEGPLLTSAATETVKTLRQNCRRVIASADRGDQAARDRRLHESRYFRSWTDPDGAIRVDGKFHPDAAPAIAAVNTKARQLRARARRAGSRQRRDAHAADAFVSLITGGGADVGTTVHLHVDYAAYKRGWLEPGEHCEIPGIGPVPVATARRLSDDAVIKAVLEDGADVRAIATIGRPIPAKVVAAVKARDRTCAWPGCDEHLGLELHHVIPIYEGGLSTVENIAGTCDWHHKLVTHHGWRLTGPPGNRTVVPPADMVPDT